MTLVNASRLISFFLQCLSLLYTLLDIVTNLYVFDIDYLTFYYWDVICK